VTYSWVFALIALGLAGWAAWFLVLALVAARQAKEELRANRLELVTVRLQAADEQVAKETALRLLDEQMRLRTEEVRTLTARLDALQQKYTVTRRLYEDSITIDGPLASRRLQ